MKITKILFMTLSLSLICSACANTIENGVTGTESNSEEKTDVEIPQTKAIQLANQLGAGWNLGNALDAYDANENNGIVGNYQLMATYTSSPYTAWDSSEIVSFENGKATLNWKIEDLNSTKDSNIGSFSFQIINQYFSDEQNTNPLTYKVEEAIYSTKDGEKVSLEEMLGEHTSSIKNAVTEYITEDLSDKKNLNTTSDLLGGTLTIQIEIVEYPVSVDNEMMSYETAWGNPKTTQDMIRAVKDAGFRSVRLPVSYRNYMDENHTIQEAWLERVAEVVQYILDEDMYCILNIHHDVGADGWIQADADNLQENQENLRYMWQQLATYFKDYGDHLLFEGFNEITDSTGDLNSTNTASYEAVNALNQTFIDTVRSSGGENENRFLVINTYAAYSTPAVVGAMTIPSDTIEEHILVEVHCYSDVTTLDTIFENLYNTFIVEGIPVIIGEFGMINTNESDRRMNYVQTFVSKATEKKLVYFWWDDGGIFNNSDSVNNFALLNRSNCTWYFTEIINVLTSPYQ